MSDAKYYSVTINVPKEDRQAIINENVIRVLGELQMLNEYFEKSIDKESVPSVVPRLDEKDVKAAGKIDVKFIDADSESSEKIISALIEIQKKLDEIEVLYSYDVCLRNHEMLELEFLEMWVKIKNKMIEEAQKKGLRICEEIVMKYHVPDHPTIIKNKS